MQTKPIIFLAFANDQKHYLTYLSDEAQQIRQQLFYHKDKIEVEERFHASLRDIFQVIKGTKITIFHYGGHADDYLMSLPQGESNIGIDTNFLNNSLASLPSLQLVFLNACLTAAQTQDLIKKGIPAVIGTSTLISDSKASKLAYLFYEGFLLQRLSLGEAWQHAVNETMAEVKGEKDLWKQVTIPEEEVRGRIDKNGRKISIPWKLYYQDEKILAWKLEDFMTTGVLNYSAHTAQHLKNLTQNAQTRFSRNCQRRLDFAQKKYDNIAEELAILQKSWLDEMDEARKAQYARRIQSNEQRLNKIDVELQNIEKECQQ